MSLKSQMNLKRQIRVKEISAFRVEEFHSDDVALEICMAVHDWLLFRPEFSRLSNNQSETLYESLLAALSEKIFYFKSQKWCLQWMKQ